MFAFRDTIQLGKVRFSKVCMRKEIDMKKRLLSSLLTIVLVLSSVPAFAAGYLEDEIWFDDLESYAAGFVPNGITGWGSNADKPVSVQELNGNMAIRYGDEKSNVGAWGRAQYGPYEGKYWVTADVLMPEGFKTFRLSLHNSNGYGICMLEISADRKLTLQEVRDASGKKQSFVLTDSLPIDDGWVSLRIHVDTDAQEVFFLYKGENDAEMTAIPGVYDFCYKLYDGASAEAKKADLYRTAFANTNSETPAGIYFYLDNFGVYYDREIVTDDGKDYVELHEILDVGDQNGYGYTFPETLSLALEGGITGDLPVSWSDESGKAVGGYTEFASEGVYVYRGNFDNTEKWAKLTLEVRDRNIVSVEAVYDSAYQFETYILPETVPAKMDDGSYKNVKVEWESENISTAETGTQVIYGRVLPWNDSVSYTEQVTLYLGVTVHGLVSVKDIYVGVPVGGSYSLPKKVSGTTDTGEKAEAAVSWNGTAPDTSRAGVYTYEGTVSGYEKPVKLRVTVYEKISDDEILMDVLLEYYGNVLTEGRDRTRYGVDASEPHPIFAAGINRVTGEHAFWQHETAGDIPLTDLASQTCLLKGLMGMTELTGDNQYRQSVYDAYQYYFDHCYYDDNGLIGWGGHMAFNMETYELWDELNVHELKDHYPLFDVMYELEPEKTEKYIKAVWAGHIKDTENLEFSRHYTITKPKDEKVVDNIFKTIQGKTGDAAFDKSLEPFFAGSEGLLTFITAANDFISAAGELYSLNGDEDALQSALDLQNMYLKGRHDGSKDGKEGTGLIPFLFTSVGKYREPILDVWDDAYTNSGFGDRIKFNLYELDQDNYYLSDFGAEYDYSIDVCIYCYNPMVMFRLAEFCDEETKEYLIREAVETLSAFLKVKYDASKNQGLPMLIDGTDLTGHVRKRTGYTGTIGASFEPWTLEADYILAFLRGYVNAGLYEDEEMKGYADTIWGGIRNMFDYYGVGDVGSAPGEEMNLNFNTDCEEPFVLISLCEAYNEFAIPEYLELARVVANNISQNRFQDGYFYTSDTQLNANFNAEEPYAILYFLATARGVAENIYEHFGSRGYFQFDWYNKATGEAKKLYSNKLWAETVAGEILAEAISLNKSELELSVGEKYTLQAMVEPEDTEDQTVEWKSSDKKVCIVDEDGIVTAVSPGTAEITATAVSGGCEAVAEVLVK